MSEQPFTAAFGFALDNQTLHQRQNRRCFLCGGKMQGRPTREHVFPRSAGGREAGNILLAHRLCNQAKGIRNPRPCELIYRDAVYLVGPALSQAEASKKEEGR